MTVFQRENGVTIAFWAGTVLIAAGSKTQTTASLAIENLENDDV